MWGYLKATFTGQENNEFLTTLYILDSLRTVGAPRATSDLTLQDDRCVCLDGARRSAHASLRASFYALYTIAGAVPSIAGRDT